MKYCCGMVLCNPSSFLKRELDLDLKNINFARASPSARLKSTVNLAFIKPKTFING